MEKGDRGRHRPFLARVKAVVRLEGEVGEFFTDFRCIKRNSVLHLIRSTML